MTFLSNLGSGIRKSFGGSTDFFRGCVQELKKVRWPSRGEMVRYTAVVVLLVTILAIFFSILDLGIGELVRLITRG